MKIKALSRSTASTQAPGSSVAKVTRNLDPNLHPFERAREYTRALNATKVERMFAQPFLGDFEPGHVDGVYSFAKDPNSLEHFASGSGDGIVKVWDFTSREEKWQAQAHENLVKGMCWTRDKKLITCGSDRQIQLFEPYAQASKSAPKATWHGNSAFTSVSHHRSLPTFAAGSSSISIYDTSRTSGAPVSNLVWPSVGLSCRADLRHILIIIRPLTPSRTSSLTRSKPRYSHHVQPTARSSSTTPARTHPYTALCSTSPRTASPGILWKPTTSPLLRKITMDTYLTCAT